MRGLAIQCLLLAFVGVILIVASHFAYKGGDKGPGKPDTTAS